MDRKKIVKKPAAAGSTKKSPPAARGAAGRPKPAPVAKIKAEAQRPAPPVAQDLTRQVLDELRGIRQAMAPAALPSGDLGTAVDASVDALRRVLGDLLERSNEAIVARLAEIRRDLAVRDATAGRGVEGLDALLSDLGAIRFEAGLMDAVDPLIHVVVEERRVPDAPDGVIVANLRPGFRTGRGLVVARAAVAVNRRA